VKQIRALVMLLLLATGSGSLSAQAVLDDPKLDSAQTVLRDALYRLRDTLTQVDAATARIARDIGTTSDQVLRSRAGVLSARCAAAAGSIPTTRAILEQRALPSPDPRKVRAQLDQALVELESQMSRCQTEFTGLAGKSRAAELRDYGVGRGERVRLAVRRIQPFMADYFASALGIRYLPNTRGMAGAVLPSNR
jgi:hypothetical protein